MLFDPDPRADEQNRTADLQGPAARLLVEALVVLHEVLGEPRHPARGADPAHEAGCMPGVLPSQDTLLQEEDLGLVLLGAVLGRGAADDAAVDEVAWV